MKMVKMKIAQGGYTFPEIKVVELNEDAIRTSGNAKFASDWDIMDDAVTTEEVSQ